MKPFIKLNVVEDRHGVTIEKPVVIGVAQIASLEAFKLGGTRVTLSSGKELKIKQNIDTLEGYMDILDKYEEPKVDVENEDDDDADADLVDPADIALVASAAAQTFAEEQGIDIADVPVGDNGKIGKNDVVKYIKSLEVEDE